VTLIKPGITLKPIVLAGPLTVAAGGFAAPIATPTLVRAPVKALVPTP
jgi:hypothetical protein